MASNELGFRCVRSQHQQAEGALRSGGLKRRPSGAVLQLSVDNGARNGVERARISLCSESTPVSWACSSLWWSEEEAVWGSFSALCRHWSSEWRRTSCVWSQQQQAEGALRSGGLKRRPSGAVLQLFVDIGARNGVERAAFGANTSKLRVLFAPAD